MALFGLERKGQSCSNSKLNLQKSWKRRFEGRATKDVKKFNQSGSKMSADINDLAFSKK